MATFELAVVGEPPAGTGFQASTGTVPDAVGALLDGDGDGVYTTSLPVERGAGRKIRIGQLDPLSPDDPASPLMPSTLEDFGLTTFDEDMKFSAGVSFDGRPPIGPDEPDSPDPDLTTDIPGVGLEVLPATGGAALLTPGVGTLLVAGSLLLRHAAG